MPYGRPMKGASRRVPTTVHIPTGTLDIIDNYIATGKRMLKPAA